MTLEELEELFDELKEEGYEEKDILGILYMMYADGKMPLEDLRTMTEVLGYEFTDEFEAMSEEDKKKNGLKKAEKAEEEVTIIGPSIKNTCWQCYNAMHWALRNNTNCAKYGKKPYEVYFEGADCPYFDKVDKLPGQPECNC